MIIKTFYALLFLLGSNLYAQGPDWSQFPGAKAILDDMELSVSKGIELEDAIDNNPSIYSNDHVVELIAVATEGTLPLIQCRDILSKARSIIDLIDAKHSDIIYLETMEKLAQEILREKPLKDLIARLHDNYDDFKDVDIKALDITDQNKVIPIIEKAVELFINKKDLTTFDIDTILGLPEDEFNNGVLATADKIIKDPPTRWIYTMISAFNLQVLRDALQVNVLCNDETAKKVSAYIAMSDGYGRVLGNALIDGINGMSFRPESSSITRMIGVDGLSKGIENLKTITTLIERN
jgi:hypothetical protein